MHGRVGALVIVVALGCGCGPAREGGREAGCWGGAGCACTSSDDCHGSLTSDYAWWGCLEGGCWPIPWYLPDTGPTGPPDCAAQHAMCDHLCCDESQQCVWASAADNWVCVPKRDASVPTDAALDDGPADAAAD
jgi:hypothetical protein